MTARRRTPAPELGGDAVDAAAGGALVGGVLAVVVPYFLGLTVALVGLLVAIAAVRRAALPRGAPGAALLATGLLAVGGAVGLVLSVPGLSAFRGPLLAAAALPIWRSARRAPAFGGA